MFFQALNRAILKESRNYFKSNPLTFSMNNYRVLFDIKAGRQIKKAGTQKEQISKIIDRMESNPESIGKFVEGSKGMIREVYIGSYRLYYTILEDLRIVYVFEFTHKNVQQKTIDSLKMKRLKEIQEELRQSK